IPVSITTTEAGRVRSALAHCIIPQPAGLYGVSIVPKSAAFGSRVITVGFLALVMLRGLAVAAEASPDALEEVTVTATKLKAERVLDLPASVQAISSESLQRDMASGIMSIAGQVPGLSIQDLGPGDKKYVIRGINSIGDSTTGVYYGEAVISGSNADDGGGFNPDVRLYDIDRVEVLRGPHRTLYFPGPLSGTISYIPHLPDHTSVE